MHIAGLIIVLWAMPGAIPAFFNGRLNAHALMPAGIFIRRSTIGGIFFCYFIAHNMPPYHFL